MRKGETIHRKELMQGSDYEIITTYQLEYRGIVEYYRLAYNMSKLTKLKWVMERSLTKTLAAKHKLSVPKVYEKYRAKRMIDGKEYTVLQASLHGQIRNP
jgi:Type II intron maturase